MDTGNTAWMLTSMALVLFMTLPGLALFYGGLVRAKNYLSVLMQCMAICGVVSIAWLVAGYSIAFGGEGTFWGGLSKMFLLDVGRDQGDELLNFMFQLTFAVITPALIIGGYAERVKFSFVLAFSVIWVLVVYAPVAHWVWGGSTLLDIAGIHPMDFAGGLVVHQSAGVAALVIAIIMGQRKGFGSSITPPAQPGMVMIGASMLWVGWFGFNGGSAYEAGATAVNALIVTQIATAAALIAWISWEKITGSKPTLIGAATGAVAGLVAITPASGDVGPVGALFIGSIAAVLSQISIGVIKRNFKIDDALDVFAVHGVAGIVGTLLTPFFATLGASASKYGDVDYNMMAQFVVQVKGVVIGAVYVAVMTAIIVLILKAITGLRADEEDEHKGLDLSSHGERAYDIS